MQASLIEEIDFTWRIDSGSMTESDNGDFTWSYPTNKSSSVVLTFTGVLCDSSFSVYASGIYGVNSYGEGDSALLTGSDSNGPTIVGIEDMSEYITVNCSDIPPVPVITSNDACESTICPEFSETVEDIHASNSNEVQRITRSWFVEDDCGYTDSFTQVITVVDTVAPTIDLASAGDVTVFDCEAGPVPCDVTAYDDCYGEFVHDTHITFTETKDSGYTSCPNSYTLTRTWRAVDNAGNIEVSPPIVITVRDVGKPTLTGVPANATVECDSVPQCESVSAVDNCEGPVDVVFDETKHDLVCYPHEYYLVRTWTAKDECGNTETGTQTVHVDDSTPPVLSEVEAVIDAQCASVPEPCVVTATDNCDESPSITLDTDMTPGNCPQEYTEVRTWTAEDECGNSDVVTQQVNVVDTQPPVFDYLPPATITAECSNPPVHSEMTATDVCDDSVLVEYTEVRTDSDSGCCSEYTLTRSYYTVDDCGNENEFIQIVSITDTQEPILQGSPMQYMNISCENFGGPPVVTGEDSCCDTYSVPVHYTERRTDGDCEDDFQIVRHWAASDCALNLAEHTQTIDVYDHDAPTFTWPSPGQPSSHTAECNNVPAAYHPNVTDNCADASVVYREERVDGSCDDQYDLIRIWTAGDDCGNFADHQITIYVSDSFAPDITAPPHPGPLECDEEDTFDDEINATDSCADVTGFGTESIIPGSCEHSFQKARRWEACDDCGSCNDAEQTVQVDDSTDPVWDQSVSNEQVNCSNIPAPPTVTATDNCDKDLTILYTETKEATSCDCVYKLTRTWSVQDDCGNAPSDLVQIVDVIDGEDPEFDFFPPNRTVNCNEKPYPTNESLTATDQDGSPVTVTYSETTITNNHGSTDCYEYERTWVAKDCSNNTVTHYATVTVEDNKAPIYHNAGSNQTVECTDITDPDIDFNSTNSYPDFTFTDNCDDDVYVTKTIDTATDCPPVDHTFTFEGEDNCGLKTDVSWTVSVVDTTPPQWTSEIPASANLECGDSDITMPAAPSYSDNCSDVGYGVEAVHEVSSVETYVNDCVYYITRNWYAYDCSGNSINAQQILTVVDSTPPWLIGVPDQADQDLYECGDVLPDCPTVTADDICDESVIEVKSSQRDDTIDNCVIQTVRTFWAEDACGNEVTDSYFLQIEDSTPPYITTNPDHDTIECNDTEYPGDDPTAGDDCDSDLDMSYNEDPVSGSCPQSSRVLRTWTFSDDCGNEVDYTQTIDIVDSISPWFTRDFDHDVYIWDHTTGDAGLLNEIDVSDWSEDNCDPNPVESCTKSKTAGVCDLIYNVTWECVTEDACGNIGDRIERDILVDISTEPELVPPPNLTIECNESLVTYTEANPPQVNTTDNEIATLITPWQVGPPEGGCVDRYTVTRTWKYVNDCGHEDTVTQYIFVDDTMDPVVTAPGDIEDSCDDPSALVHATAEDNCDDNPTYEYSSTQIYTENCAEHISVRTWTFYDNCGNDGSDDQTVTVYDDQPPVIQNKPNDDDGECPDYVFASHVLHATDNCDTPDVEYTENVVEHCPYWVIRKWETEDCAGNSDDHQQTIKIDDTTPPVWVVADPDFQTDPTADPVIKYFDCNHDIPEPPSVAADDACDGNLPVHYTENTVGNYPGGDYNITREWRAVDDCGNDIDSSMILVVRCSAPPQNTTADCHDVPNATNIEQIRLFIADNITIPSCTVTVDDMVKTPGSCDNSYELLYTFKIDCADQAPYYIPWLVSVVDRHQPQWTTSPLPANENANCTHDAQVTMEADDNCGAYANQTGPILVTPTQTKYDPDPTTPNDYYVYNEWTAEDACGHSISHTQTITVSDPLPPYFTTVLNDTIYAECDEDLEPPTVHADDDCGNVTIDRTDNVLQDDCPDSYRLIRKWTATDESGQTATATQTLYVTDSTPPYFADPIDPADDCIEYECPTTPPASSAKLLKDNCAADQYIPVTTTCWGDDCTSYTLRTWEGEDECGNSATMDQTVKVTDTVPPELLDIPDDTEAPCDGIPAFSLAPYATDECDSDVELTKTEAVGSFVEGGCEEYTITRYWVAEDNCGNDDCKFQNITIYDDTPPELSGVPAPETYECSDVGTLVDPTADDNCDDDVSVVTTETTINPVSDECTWTVLYDFSAADDCGNEVDDSVMVTVVDTTPPYFNGPELGVDTGICDHGPAYPQTAGDLCDTDVDVLFTEEKHDGSCPSEYNISRKWVATDCGGNTAERTQLVIVLDNGAPTLHNVPDFCEPVSCDESTAVPDVFANDTCDGDVPVEYSETKVPGSCPQEYKLVRTWSATDLCGNPISETRTLSVYDDEAPAFTPPAPDTQECDEFDQLPSFNATDNCDEPLGEEQEQTCTGFITTTSGDGCFVMSLTCTACDDCGNCDTQYTTLDIDDTTPPEIHGVPNATTNECKDLDPQVDLTANDTCDDDVEVTKSFNRQSNGDCTESMLYTWTAKDDCGNTASVSQDILIDDTTPPFFDSELPDETLECKSFAPCHPPSASDICDDDVEVDWSEVPTNGSCDGNYYYTRTFTAKDDCGNEAEFDQVITFVDTTPPTFSTEPDNYKTEYCNITDPEVLVGEDNCDDNPNVTAAETKLISSEQNNTIYHRTWVVTDDCGNSYSFTQTIRIMDNLDPYFIGLAVDKTVQCHQVPTFADITAGDDCDGDVSVEKSEIRVDGSCDHEYTLIRSWYTEDSAGNSKFMDQTITVRDDDAPNMYGSSPHDTQECNHTDAPTYTANDTCPDSTVTVEDSEIIVPTAVSTEYFVYRDWTATDECGNTDSRDQTITVLDRTPPTLLVPAPQTVECGQVPLCFPGSYNSTDDCEGPLDVVYSESTIDNGCPCEYTLVRTFYTVDSAGNDAQDTQTILVQDNTPPELHNVPADRTIGHLNELPPLADALNGVLVTDNSGYGIVPTVTESGDGVTTWTRTFRAEDCSDNSDEEVQNIVLIDTTPPELPPVDDDTVECDEIPEPCDDEYMHAIGEPSLSVLYSEVKEDISSGQTLFRLIRTWYVEDDSSNSDEEVQTIIVMDTAPPLLSRYPESVTVECDCDSIPVQPTLKAIDNCDDVTVTPDTQTLSGGSAFDYTLVWTWTAEDSAGNSVSHTASVVVRDTSAPELVLTPAHEAVSCDAVPVARDNFARDNCDAGVNDPDVYDYVQTHIPSGNCPQEYQLVRHWETYDHSAASHYVSHTQTISVSDNSAPEFISAGGDYSCVTPDEGGDFGVFDNLRHSIFRSMSLDDCTDKDDLQITITGCNSTQFSQVDDFSGSCIYSSGPDKLYVRATRNDDGSDGRRYTVYATIRDQCDQSVSGSLTIWVPQDIEDSNQLGMTCVDASIASTYTG